MFLIVVDLANYISTVFTLFMSQNVLLMTDWLSQCHEVKVTYFIVIQARSEDIQHVFIHFWGVTSSFDVPQFTKPIILYRGVNFS